MAGKKYVEACKLIEKGKTYNYVEAVALAKKTNCANFDASVEVSFNLNVDPRHADQAIRGAMVLPNGTGKSKKILVITRGAKEQEAKDAGADIVGGKEILEDIKKGWFDFDIIVATPDMMAELGKLGKILGPKGLMPNPKTGTVTTDVEKAVKEVKAGRVEYRTDSFGNIHGIIGNTDFEEKALLENLEACMAVLIKAKPSTVKGDYIKNISIATTMGPGIKIITNSFDK